MPTAMADTRHVTARTVAYYLAFLMVGLATAALGPSIPSFAGNTGVSIATIGGLFVFQRIGYIAGSLGGGPLLDRLSGKHILATAMVVMAIGLFLLPQWAVVVGVFVTILMIGLAQGTAEVGANTGVVWLHGDNAGPVMNGLHLSFGVGAIVSPIIVSQSLTRLGSIRVGYFVLAALALAASLWWLRLPRAPRETSTAESTGGIPRMGLVLLFAMLLFLVIAGESGFAGWIYSYVVAVDLMPEARAGYLTSAFWAALTLGRLAGIDLVRRLGPRRLVFLSLIGCVVAVMLFLLFPDSAKGAWTVAVLLGFAQSSIVPAVFTLAGRARILTGSVGGVFVAFSAAGGMSLPWLVGRYFEAVGPIVLVWLLAASQFLAFALFLVISLRLQIARRH